MDKLQVVHILPDNSQQVIATVDDASELERYVEIPRWLGTWITPERKLLRFNRGELRIKRLSFEMKVTGSRPVQLHNTTVLEITIVNGGELDTIRVVGTAIVAYNRTGKELWRCASFTSLAGIVDKEVAYQCMLHYDRYINAHKLQAAL